MSQKSPLVLELEKHNCEDAAKLLSISVSNLRRLQTFKSVALATAEKVSERMGYELSELFEKVEGGRFEMKALTDIKEP